MLRVLDDLDVQSQAHHGPGVPNYHTGPPLLTSCNLTDQHCEIVGSALQSSNSPLRELDLSQNHLKDSGVKLLCAGLKSPNCQLNTLRLTSCNLTDQHCEIVGSALQSSNSPLRELVLSQNHLKDSGVKLLCTGLKSPNCQLNTLRLSGCLLTDKGYAALASALSSNPFHLRELDLSYNNPGQSGVNLPFDAFKYVNNLNLASCYLTDQHCEVVGSALQSTNSRLRKLDLSHNDLQDSGVELLCAGLKSPNCQLNILRLSYCMVTAEGCAALASALSSNPSHLRELDLSYNHPGESGAKLLNHLDKLNVDHGGEFRIRAGPQKYACDLTLDTNTVNEYLTLSDDNRKVTKVGQTQSYPYHPDRFDWYQVLCVESLTGRCYWETEWSGDNVHISVSYKEIQRKGVSADSMFGSNVNSWSLFCNNHRFSVWHNQRL
ncbi:uncharacterized protein [Garra rufa]|uniref:uncharacterized protein n=1 Tax=Garra rufa TaxID=137080 RepID=UPI003CCE676F